MRKFQTNSIASKVPEEAHPFRFISLGESCGFVLTDRSSSLSFSSESPCQQLRFISNWPNCNLPSFPRGFYAQDGICEHCSSPCRTCEGNATNCHSCEGDFVLDHGVCLKTCPEKHVAMEGVCKHCPENCQDCIHEETCKGTWKHPGEKHILSLAQRNT